jgi:ribosomal protein S18 acetylase RimI-like enzyme
MASTVRVATPAELPSASAVWASANAARGKSPSPQRAARVQQKLADPDAVVLVAVKDRDVIGMLLAEQGRSDDGEVVVTDLGHISMVFVRPDCQGRGVGAELLSELVEAARDRGWRRLSLWTRRSNSSARSLYQKQGFVVTDETKSLLGGDMIDRWECAL